MQSFIDAVTVDGGVSTTVVKNALVKLVEATAKCLGEHSKNNKSADPLCGFGYSRKHVAGKNEVDAFEQVREILRILWKKQRKQLGVESQQC